jgi:hypothetical protein
MALGIPKDFDPDIFDHFLQLEPEFLRIAHQYSD